MKLIPLKTAVITEQSDLLGEIEKALKNAHCQFKNEDILVITSKVVSVVEGRKIKLKNPKHLEILTKNEADVWLGGKPYPFAIKNGILIPRSGIDESNTEKGTAILWSTDPWASAEKLRKTIIKKFKLKKFGVIITDSTCRPLRWGVTNIAISWAGFTGLTDERGKKDLYGRKLRVTRRATADALAAAAGALSGEAAERIPCVLIRDTTVEFTNKTKKPPVIQPKEDLFYPVYSKKFRRLKISAN